MASKKRKRDLDYSRITYHAAVRTFDRLFKEESLSDLKEMVRQKLGLASDVNVELRQLRAGLTVDLEDDDDFDAFYALSRTTPALDVRVTVIANDQIDRGRDSPQHTGSWQLTVNEGQRNRPAFAESTPVQQQFHVSRPSTSTSQRKRKVSFVDSPQTGIPIMNAEAKRRKNNSEGVTAYDILNTSGPSNGESGSNLSEDNSMSVGGGLIHMDQPTSSEIVTKKKKKLPEGRADSRLSPSRNGAHTPPAADFPMTPSDDDEQHPPVKKKRPNPSGVLLHEVSPPTPSSRGTHVGGPLVAKTAVKQKRRSTMESAFDQQLVNSNVQAGDANEGPSPPKKKKKRQKFVEEEQAKGGPEPDPGNNNAVAKSAGKKKIGDDVHRDISKDMDEANASVVVPTKTKKPKTKTSTEVTRTAVKVALSHVLVGNGPATQASGSATPQLDDNVVRDQIEVGSADQPKLPKQSDQSKLRLSRLPEDVQNFPNNVNKHSTPNSKKSTRTRQSDRVPCPVCLKKPLHLRYQCPVITAGPVSIMKRLLELKEKPLDDQVQLIEELEHLIKEGKTKRAKKPEPPAISGMQISSNQSLSDNISDVPVAEAPGLASSILPATKLDPRSQISDSVGDLPSEDSSRKDSDESSEGDEDERSDAPSPKSLDGLGTTTLSTYANIDLDVLIHGPPSSRPSNVANILANEAQDDDEEEVEAVILEEEEDDTKFRRLSKRLQMVESSSDEDDLLGGADDGNEDITSPSPDHVPEQAQAQSTRSDDRSPSAGCASFQAVDGMGESVEADQRGDIAFSDALSLDTSASKLGQGSEDDIQVASSGDTVDDTSLSVEKPLSTRKQKEVPTVLVQAEQDSHEDRVCNLQAESGNPARVTATSCNKPAPQQVGDVAENVTDITLATKDRLPSPQRSKSIVTPLEAIKQVSQHQPFEEDPIEPADDLLEIPEQPKIDASKRGRRGQSAPPMPTTTKGGRLGRMMDKRGRVPTAEVDLSVLKAGAGTQESGEQGITKRARTATRSASAQPPVRATTPGKRPRGRPPKTAEQKAHEAAEKVAAREEKARLKEEKARLKQEKEVKGQLRQEKAELATKRKPGTKDLMVAIEPTSTQVKESSHATPHTPLQNNDPRPLRLPPSSPPQWAALPQSSPATDPDSSDELQYSSPKRKEAVVALSKRGGRRDGSVPKDAALQEDPLFMLTESQVPFPYSQWDDSADNQPRSQPATVSGSESEDEPATNRTLTRPRVTRTSGSSYRKLTDIASQQGLFPVPPLPTAAPPARSVTGSKFHDTDEDDEDEEDDTDDSGSDYGTEKSHIPLSRRAGASLLHQES